MSTQASWVESMPAVYDRCLGPALFAPFADHVAARAEGLAPHRVLEIAAGTGIATAALVRSLPGARIVATDLNAAMVAWSAGRVPGATWVQADANALGFADRCFDLVVCQFGAMFFPDKPAAFREVARVLEPGAAALFAVWDSVERSRFPAAMVASLGAVFPRDAPNFLVRVPHGYSEPDRIEADLRAGGLRADAIERVVLRGTAPSARVLTEGFCLGTPLRFALAERGPLDELTDALAQQMSTRLGDGPLEGDAAALIVSARLA